MIQSIEFNDKVSDDIAKELDLKFNMINRQTVIFRELDRSIIQPSSLDEYQYCFIQNGQFLSIVVDEFFIYEYLNGQYTYLCVNDGKPLAVFDAIKVSRDNIYLYDTSWTEEMEIGLGFFERNFEIMDYYDHPILRVIEYFNSEKELDMSSSDYCGIMMVPLGRRQERYIWIPHNLELSLQVENSSTNYLLKASDRLMPYIDDSPFTPDLEKEETYLYDLSYGAVYIGETDKAAPDSYQDYMTLKKKNSQYFSSSEMFFGLHGLLGKKKENEWMYRSFKRINYEKFVRYRYRSITNWKEILRTNKENFV